MLESFVYVMPLLMIFAVMFMAGIWVERRLIRSNRHICSKQGHDWILLGDDYRCRRCNQWQDWDW